MKKLSVVFLLFAVGLLLAISKGDDLVGKTAPDFSLQTLSGNGDIALKDYRGKIVLLDFWASWCGPCKKSLPKLEKLEAKYPGLKVLTVNIDDERENARDFMKRYGLDLTVVFDAEKSAAETYGVSAMPAAVLIDQTGIVRHINSGYTAKQLQEFEILIKALSK